jgi:hypothetical protein
VLSLRLVMQQVTNTKRFEDSIDEFWPARNFVENIIIGFIIGSSVWFCLLLFSFLIKLLCCI